MCAGPGIFLIVVGAILAFAVRDRIDAIDLTTIGWIMMGGGVLAALISLVNGNRTGRMGSGYASRSTSHVDPNTGTRVDETRIDGI